MRARIVALCACLGLVSAAQAQSPSPAPPDEATEVSDVVVRSPPTEVPIPDVGPGAPAYSTRQLEIMRQPFQDAVATNIRARLEAESSGASPVGIMRLFDANARSMNKRAALSAARTATARAEQVRREAARGLRTQKEVEEAELARQAAVRLAVGEVPRAQRLEAVRLPPVPTALDNFQVRLERENFRSTILVVSGTLRNVTEDTVAAPPINIIVLDGQNFVLAQKSFDPGIRIEAGKSRNFNYYFPDPPPNLKEIRVTLAAPSLVAMGAR